MRIIVCLLNCVLLVPLLAAVAVAADEPVTADTVRIASDDAGATIEVRPLDDPANPYAGQYEAWDIWTWDNYTPGFKHSDYRFDYDSEPPLVTGPDGEALPEGWMYSQAMVDAEGFLVPQRQQWSLTWSETSELPLRDFIQHSYIPRLHPVTYSLYSAGVKPAELALAEKDALWESAARQYPVIPAWLGEHMPLEVVFSPNGDILTFGELDLYYQELTEVRLYPRNQYFADEVWYRYSVDGELLGSYSSDEPRREYTWDADWTAVYCPDRHQRISAALAEISKERNAGNLRTTNLTNQGYIALALLPETDNMSVLTSWLDGAEILRAWDMYGEEVPLDTMVRPDSCLGRPIERQYLEPAYAAQVRLGLTDPAAVSPFAGLENGPQLVDPTPRFPRLLARKSNNWMQTRAVLPPDDPANPYQGEYREWDDWLLGQFGARNPREQEYNLRMYRERQAVIEAKQAAGEEVTQADYQHAPYVPDADDPWREYEIHVDDAGWMIPAHRFPEVKAAFYKELLDVRQMKYRPEPGGYSIQVGGAMPEAMRAEYEAACRAPVDSGLPVVPAWLAGVPVHMVVFVPNGDIVTLGPLGHRTAENFALAYQPQGWGEDERAWYRYDAAGNLLDTYVSKADDWQVLYYPQWNALKANALDTGMQARELFGYLVIDDPVTGECRAVFDYDGMPVDPNSLVSRPWGYCTALYWGKVLEFPVAGGGEVAVPEDHGAKVNLHEQAAGNG